MKRSQKLDAIAHAARNLNNNGLDKAIELLKELGKEYEYVGKQGTEQRDPRPEAVR